jgi:hypothetical protein
MMGIEIQNLPVDALRFGKFSALVKLNGVGAHAMKVHGRTLAWPPWNKVQGAVHGLSVSVRESSSGGDHGILAAWRCQFFPLWMIPVLDILVECRGRFLQNGMYREPKIWIFRPDSPW